jgi:gas vesicle protein
MRALHKILILLSAAAFAFAIPAVAQDEPPSLGDAARQARLQKQQKDAQATKDAPAADAQNVAPQGKDAQAKTPAKDSAAKGSTGKDAPAKDATAGDAQTAKTSHVITNDEIPSHVGSTVNKGRGLPQDTNQPNYSNGKASAEQWTSAIQQMKNSILSMQSQINSLTASIQYAGGNCVSGCVEWNEHQKQKQDQIESMKSQLEEMQRRLEDMQDAARQQGYGSSVYDP